jgi:AraC-like DNA-binding protein
LRYIRYLEAVGTPVDRLLARSGIPAVLLDHPMAAVPHKNALRFVELACRSVGTEHVGLYVGLESELDNLGPYGEMLQRALTLHEYLRKGISLYNTTNTGQRLWLTKHGEELRFRVSSLDETGVAVYQEEMEALVVTLARCKQAVGPEWSPGEIRLAYRSKEALPDIELFHGSRILSGTGETYFTLPPALLQRRFPNGGRRATSSGDDPTPSAEGPLPEDLGGLVQLEVRNLLPHRIHQIDVVAEALAMSSRSLQRALARQGLSYSRILDEVRLRQAADWLGNTDKQVEEIAFDLGYTDASNFARAFRRQSGVSPQSFRRDREIDSPQDR